jgi:hypothetical protein
MITRAVFSYFNAEESFSNKAGFRYFSDFLYSMALSTLLARRHFKTVQVISSSWGEKVLREAGIPATEYSTALNVMKDQRVSKWFWAYGKLIAYAQQTEPFVHIDNDAFLWQPLPERVLNAELCFQSKEFFDMPYYKWYGILKPSWEAAKTRPQTIVDNEVDDFVYNCGICGGSYLGFFKERIKCSSEYIFAPENHDVFFEDFKDILMHQNLFHEQYFAASLVKAHGLRDKVQLIAEDISDPQWMKSNKMYTHIWGGTKVDQTVMRRVRSRLLKESSEVYDQVTAFVNNYLSEECPKDAIVTKVTV